MTKLAKKLHDTGKRIKNQKKKKSALMLSCDFSAAVSLYRKNQENNPCMSGSKQGDLRISVRNLLLILLSGLLIAVLAAVCLRAAIKRKKQAELLDEYEYDDEDDWLSEEIPF